MSLENGDYFISSVSFATGEPVTRPLGASQTPEVNVSEVVVLPLHSPPPKWTIHKLETDHFSISLGGRNARIVDGTLVVSPARLPAFQWVILRGAPHPPPIGNDSYGIIVPNQQPQQSWLIPSTEGDQAVEVQVLIGDVASSIVITPVEK